MKVDGFETDLETGLKLVSTLIETEWCRVRSGNESGSGRGREREGRERGAGEGATVSTKGPRTVALRVHVDNICFCY